MKPYFIKQQTPRKKIHIFTMIIGILLLTTKSSWASCTISNTGVIFGKYDIFSVHDLDTTGTINVNCSSGTPYSITMSAGFGNYETRQMKSGINILNYNLYTNATYITLWGDGTNGSATVNGEGTGTSVSHTVYGRIAHSQNPPVGSYSDNIVVTVIF